MKFKIKATVSLRTNLEPHKLVDILQPENETPDNSYIQSFVEDENVVTIIEGKFSVATLLRSIDDILATTSLATEVANSTE